MNSDSRQKIIPPDILLNGYRQGLFPMSESRDDDTVSWFTARKRGILPLNSFKVSSNVQRIIRRNTYTCRINSCFRTVVEACANRNSTWISELIINSYEVLHLAGYAQSVEVFDRDEKLAGGLYGVSLGTAFFGESMFKNSPEADKVALWHCHQILKMNGFTLWDTQFYTDHLAQFGCVEISPDEYEKLLENALAGQADFVTV